MRLAGPLPQGLREGGVCPCRLFLLWQEGPHRQGLPRQLEGIVQERRLLLWMRLRKTYYEKLPQQTSRTEQASYVLKQRLVLIVSYFIIDITMRTLAKPPKVKQQQHPQGEGEKKEGKQQPSKKLTKTVFHSPFRYKIQTLNLEDGEIVTNFLINYAKTLRAQYGSEVKPVKNEKFISFASKVKLSKPTLSVPHLIYGVKQITSGLKQKESKIKLTIIFYDESKHDNLEELLCSIIYYKSPYILLRQSQKLKDELGLKQLLAMGLTVEQFANDLSVYCSRCLIEIPWLVDAKWIPLA